MYKTLKYNQESPLSFIYNQIQQASDAFLAQKQQEAYQITRKIIQYLKKSDEEDKQKKHVSELKTYERALSEVYVNLASIMINLPIYSNQMKPVQQILDLSIKNNKANHWAYFNLASLYYNHHLYPQALNNLQCSLSCLYVIKASLSLQSAQSRQMYLSKAIGLSSNNMQARLMRLMLLTKQSKLKIALNQIQYLIENVIDNDTTLQNLKRLILSLNKLDENEYKQQIADMVGLIYQLNNSHNERLLAEVDQGSIDYKYSIDQAILEFNQVFAEVNALGCSISSFHQEHRQIISTQQNPIIVIYNQYSNAPQDSTQKIQLIPQKNEHQHHQNHEQQKYQNEKVFQSLFQLSKSNNYMNNSNNIINGNLISSIQVSNTHHQQDNSHFLNEITQRNYMEKIKQEQIQQIQSQIQSWEDSKNNYNNDISEQLLIRQASQDSLNKFRNKEDNQDEELLLESLSYPQIERILGYQAPRMENIKMRKDSNRIQIYQTPINLYPIEQGGKTLQVILQYADLRQDNRQKLKEIYCFLEYNSGFVDKIKFRSRHVTTESKHLEWNESLGFIKLPEEPQNIVIKMFKSEPYLYNDRLLGQGQIEVKALGAMKIPLYHSIQCIGTVSIQFNLSEQVLNNSGKPSSVSIKSEELSSKGE